MLTDCFLWLLMPVRTPLEVILATWLAFPFLVCLLKSVALWALSLAGVWQLRVVVIGSSQAAAAALSALRSEPVLGFEVAGSVDLSRVIVMNRHMDWHGMLQRYEAQMILLALERHGDAEDRLIGEMVRSRVAFAVMPQRGALPIFGCDQTFFVSHDTVLLSYRNNLARPFARWLKGAVDLAAALCALVLLAPALALIALLVKLDGGPVLYGHVRIGEGGKPFTCLKFRSMVRNSAAVLQGHLAADEVAAAEWARSQKLRNDPRITRVGAVLRQLSLDELPQLFNVLRGEMSLVGPRPIVKEEVSRYADDIAFYYETKPGLTGLWQVSGRSDTTYQERVHLDTWYVKNWTIWTDLAIVLKTVPALLQRRGAF